jgi:DNA-directed RNA polymerase delta subunit
LEIVTSEKYPNSVFFKKNGVVVMEQNKKNKRFWFDYDDIWSFFESFLGMEYQQIEEVLSYWLEETLKLEGYTPIKSYHSNFWKLEETLKLK